MTARQRAVFRILVSLLLGAAPLAAQAQEAPPPSAASPPPSYAPAPRSPIHRGVFLQMLFGAGYTSFIASGGSSGTEKFTGRGIGFHIALGGGVTDNLALFGSLFDWGMSNYEHTVGGTDLGKVDAGGTIRGGGFGAIYYFEPINLYVSGTLGLESVVVEDPSRNMVFRQSNEGIGFEAMVGKEWLVSRHWGLGVTLELLGATKMQEQDDSAVSWSATAANLLFSVTFY